MEYSKNILGRFSSKVSPRLKENVYHENENEKGEERARWKDLPYIHGSYGMCGRGVLGCIKNNLLLLLLILSVIVGVMTGMLIRKYHPDWTDKDQHGKRKRMYLQYLGELFLRMLHCIIIPLIVSSLISGMAGLPGKFRGKISGYAGAYSLTTTLVAVILGIIIVTLTKPGKHVQKDKTMERVFEPADFILDLMRNIFPINIVSATFEQTKTNYKTTEANITAENGRVIGTEKVIDDFEVITVGGTNMLGLVVFSVVLGIVLGILEEKGQALKESIDSLMLAVIEMVRLIIWFAPIGICFLLAERMVRMEDPSKEFTTLAVFIGTVTAGLAIHGLIILPGTYLVVVRKNPFKFAVHMMQALILAFGTASSSATLPVTMRCAQCNARVDPRISGFMLPVGATINMNGTALFLAVATIFVAQVNDIPLGVGDTITICVTATIAAIGAAGVPDSGLGTLTVVLNAVGLPVEDVALIIAVDWLLDRFRTCVNVWGDAILCGVVEALTHDELRRMDAEEEEMKRKRSPSPYASHTTTDVGVKLVIGSATSSRNDFSDIAGNATSESSRSHGALDAS